MAISYQVPSGNPFLGDVTEWNDSERFDLTEQRKKMKILIATEKPFAKKALDGIKDILAKAGYEVALLEKPGIWG